MTDPISFLGSVWYSDQGYMHTSTGPRLISTIFCHSKMKNVLKRSFLRIYYHDQNPRTEFTANGAQEVTQPLVCQLKHLGRQEVTWLHLESGRVGAKRPQGREGHAEPPHERGRLCMKHPQLIVRMLPISFTRWFTDFLWGLQGGRNFPEVWVPGIMMALLTNYYNVAHG